jgi:hypothetical protein
LGDYVAEKILEGVRADVGSDIDHAGAVCDGAGQLVVTDPLLQTWLVRHADLIGTRLNTLVQNALTDPELRMESLTPPPPPGHAHDAWRAAMRHVLVYRDRYLISDPVNPLGLGGQVGERGDAHIVAARALEAITATGDIKGPAAARSQRRSMERVPMVLAEARAPSNAHAAQPTNAPGAITPNGNLSA